MNRLPGIYCRNLYEHERLQTKEVFIGDLPLGGHNPIRIQSMTSTPTLDTEKTVWEAIRMIEAGCEYVRITAQSIKEAESLTNIKASLRKASYKTPLIADVHFSYKIAETAAHIVEKVRINPGNYFERKNINLSTYSYIDYNDDVDRIAEKIKTLVGICKENGTAIRIGVNHGSLSERIMSRYGDTVDGMLASAMEYLRIFESESFDQIVISMKSSNPKTMVYANRLLVQQMHKESMNYPLHLGVTEAGEGEDGRIKSAAGIGSLLEDGIGGTIRVSLTEDPEKEIPVAQKIIDFYKNRPIKIKIAEQQEIPINPFDYKRRKSYSVEKVGGSQVPVVISSSETKLVKEVKSDYIFTKNKISIFPFLQIDKFLSLEKPLSLMTFVEMKFPLTLQSELLHKLSKSNKAVLVLTAANHNDIKKQRQFIFQLIKRAINTPIIIKKVFSESDLDSMFLSSSTYFSPLLIDGLIDGIWIENSTIDISQLEILAFNILQSCSARTFKTEFIACPSCGRTLFNIQKRLKEVKSKTSHLKGLKIAVMGCIVNGLGEMADADYGYVGTGINKVSLYKKKELVIKNISSEIALEKLIELIKLNGDWVEKEL